MAEYVEGIRTVRFIASGILVTIGDNIQLSELVNHDTIVATYEIFSII